MRAFRPLSLLVASTFLLGVGLHAEDARIVLFDMEAMRDASSLDVKVIQDWHRVEGELATRQKLISIHVGEFWSGQEYRVPVRLVVPADKKAKGFRLTGGNVPQQLQKDTRLRPLDKELIRGGVGLVYTVVQVLERSGQGKLGQEVHRRFIKSLDPRVTVKYWGWPASLMRGVTAAYAENDHFEVGKVALSGGSKNGASPSVAIIHDERMTAIHSSVAPIWDSPLRMCDRKAWDELAAYNERYAEGIEGGKERLLNHGFLGGFFGPIYNREALAAGHSWEELTKLAHAMADRVFITRNLEALKGRGVDLYFHPGTHDFVAYDLAWGGEHHPKMPIYLKANSGHGSREGHPHAERGEQNKSAFLLQHFFEDAAAMLEPPAVKHEVVGDRLRVTVRFKPQSGAESGRIFWMFNRGPDGSAAYLREKIPDNNSAEMEFDKKASAWIAEIPIDSKASHLDFFSNHRKTITYRGKKYPTYLSSPYTRVPVPKK